jgi:hypothetical protein
MNRNLPGWAYLVGVWLFWFVAGAVVFGATLAFNAMGLMGAR